MVQLTTIIEGVPAGLSLVADDINEELARRQKGYGRGRRMQIETDRVQILSGVRHGETLGSLLHLLLKIVILHTGQNYGGGAFN